MFYYVLHSKMRKIIKKIGNSVGIIFDKEDCIVHEVGKGDVIEISIKHICTKKTRIENLKNQIENNPKCKYIKELKKELKDMLENAI